MANIKLTDLPKELQEQVRAADAIEAQKHVQKLMKDPLYEQIMWAEFFKMLEKKKKKMEKRYPYKTYKLFALIDWFLNKEV
jgi:hypothetical protein